LNSRKLKGDGTPPRFRIAFLELFLPTPQYGKEEAKGSILAAI
jgi:hypothetical protein